jgi:hypothetical protein
MEMEVDRDRGFIEWLFLLKVVNTFWEKGGPNVQPRLLAGWDYDASRRRGK